MLITVVFNQEALNQPVERVFWIREPSIDELVMFTTSNNEFFHGYEMQEVLDGGQQIIAYEPVPNVAVEHVNVANVSRLKENKMPIQDLGFVLPQQRS